MHERIEAVRFYAVVNLKRDEAGRGACELCVGPCSTELVEKSNIYHWSITCLQKPTCVAVECVSFRSPASGCCHSAALVWYPFAQTALTECVS
jgi:hypothetical protein